MKLLITGVHGFVGSNLVAYFKNDHQLYGLDIVAPEKEGVIKTYSWEDVDNGTLPDVDAIIHLAGKAHDTSNKSEADVYFKVNTDLTKRIFDYFTQHTNIRKFIFFSSVKAAVDKGPGDILTEDVKPCPVGPYGESKVKAEEYIQAVLEGNKDKFYNRNIIILRPCMIHGPGNKGNLNLLYGFVKKGLPWPLGSFNNRRTFTSVDNLSFVIDGLLSKNVDSGVYNMSDDEPLSTNELIDIMCSVMQRRAHIWKINASLVRFTAKLGDFLHLPLNSFRLTKLTENYVVSNDKIKKALGVNHMPVDTRTGLKKTIRSFLPMQG